MASRSVLVLADQPGLRSNRACRICIQLKAKCVPYDDSLSICERCHRLGKICTTPAPRKRGRQKSAKPLSDHAQDQIIATPESMDTLFSLPLPPPPPPLLQTKEPPTTFAEPCATDFHDYIPKDRSRMAGTVFDISPEIGHTFAIPFHLASFEYFKTRMNKYFPFVIISSTMTPSIMHKERPFLYCCCVTAALHRDPPLQARIARDILKYISEHMLLGGEKSLDLLQGLLISLSWYHVYAHVNPQLMNLLHLAKALAVDLGLNRPARYSGFNIKMSIDATKLIHGSDLETEKHSLEERRAYLGLYHINHRYAVAYERLDHIPWSDHLEDCCSVLQEAAEYRSDACVVALVRLSHLLDGYVGSNGLSHSSSVPPPTYTKLFLNDLQRFKNALPSDLQEDHLMASQIQITEILCFRTVLSATCEIPAQKVEGLHVCFSKVLAFFDLFTSPPAEGIPDIHFLDWSALGICFDVYAKLLFVVTEGWDLEYVRTAPGFVAVLEKIIAKMHEVQSAEEKNYPTSRCVKFKFSITRLQKFQQWFQLKIQKESSALEQTTSADDSAEQVPTNPIDSLHTGEFSDLLWRDFVLDWSCFDHDFNLS